MERVKQELHGVKEEIQFNSIATVIVVLKRLELDRDVSVVTFTEPVKNMCQGTPRPHRKQYPKKMYMFGMLAETQL